MMTGGWVVILAILVSLVKNADLTTVVHNEILLIGWRMNMIEIVGVTRVRYIAIMNNEKKEETPEKTRWSKIDKDQDLPTNANLLKIIEDLQKDKRGDTRGLQSEEDRSRETITKEAITEDLEAEVEIDITKNLNTMMILWLI